MTSIIQNSYHKKLFMINNTINADPYELVKETLCRYFRLKERKDFFMDKTKKRF